MGVINSPRTSHSLSPAAGVDAVAEEVPRSSVDLSELSG